MMIFFNEEILKNFVHTHMDWYVFFNYCQLLLLLLLLLQQDDETHKILWHFEIQNDHPIPARRLDHVLIYKKKRTGHLVDFALLANNRGKMKENEKLVKYLDIAIELKKKSCEAWSWWWYQLQLVPLELTPKT